MVGVFFFGMGDCPPRATKFSFHPEHHEGRGSRADSISLRTQSPRLPPGSLREASRLQVPLTLCHTRTPSRRPLPQAALGISPPFVLSCPTLQPPAPAGMPGPGAPAGLPRPPGAPSGQCGRGGAAPAGAGAGFRAAGGAAGSGAGVRGRRGPLPGERRRGGGGAQRWKVQPSRRSPRSRLRGGAGAGGREPGLRGCQSRLPHAGPHRAEACSPPAKPPEAAARAASRACGSRRVPPGPAGSLRPGGPARALSSCPVRWDFVAGARRWGEWMMSRSKGAVSLFEDCV